MHRCLKCAAEFATQPGWICPATATPEDTTPCGGQAWAILPDAPSAEPDAKTDDTSTPDKTEKASPPAAVSDQSGKTRKDTK